MNAPSALKAPPYKIEAKEIEERYARGWHCLGLANRFTEKPVALNYFGTKLAAYRGEDGQVHILDGYCPHMGADLTLGCVEGNSLRCPFHSWRWGADGVCDEIPYAKRIPPKAVIKSWPTMEQNNLLFVWNDPEGNGPIAEQSIPRIDDCFSPDWTSWAVEVIHIPINARELVDNMADVAHFGPTHGANATSFKNIVDGHVYTQQMTSHSEILAEDSELQSEATYYGPAYMNTYMSGQMSGIDVASRLLVAHVPIDTNSFDLYFGVMIKKNPALSDAQNDEIVKGYVEANRTAFYQDVAIWKTKTRIDNPLLCDGDGPVNLLRQWYSQFYQNIAEVGDKWKQHKEFVPNFNSPLKQR
jgi:3-ketosteroid 9alpha-monooxygenase subunit A